MVIPVAHVMRTYGVYGGERQLGRLFEADSASEFANTFLSIYRNPKCEAYYSTIPGLRQKILLGVAAEVFPSLRTEMLRLMLFLPWLQLRALWFLWRGNYAICVAHGVQGAAACWLSALLLRRTRFVYVHRGTKSEAGSHPVFRLLYRPYRVVAGNSVATTASLVGLVDPARITTLENGIDWEAFVRAADECARNREARVTLISSARLLPHKRQSFILDALALLVREKSDIMLILAGDGPEQQSLAQKVEQLGLAGNVRMIGRVNDIACWLVNSDIFVHASEVEGMSNAVLEAMTLELPSIVVDAPGVSECHIDGETGFVVPRDPRIFAEKVKVLLNDAPKRRAMGRNARQRVAENYSIAANVRRYHDLYARLLAGA